MKTRRLISMLLAIVMLLSLGMTAAADPLLGTEDNIFPPDSDPVLIATKAQFAAIRNDLNGYYQLTADLEFTVADFVAGGVFYNEGNGFVPFGAFYGYLDGNGHSVHGLTIGKGNAGRYGLFATNEGVIKDLRLTGVTLNADDAADEYALRIGALAGDNYGCIENCSVYGDLNVKTDNSRTAIGGMVGVNCDTLVNCAAVTDIKVKRNCDAILQIGGMTGSNERWTDGSEVEQGYIAYCYARPTVTVESNGTFATALVKGRLAGRNQDAVITRCYYIAAAEPVGEEIYANAEAGGVIKCTAVDLDDRANAANYTQLSSDVWRIACEPVLKAFACVDADGNKKCDVCDDEVITVAPPAIITNPTNKSVTIGNSATFIVSAEGEGIGFQWYGAEGDMIALSDGANFSGTKTARLTVNTAGTEWCKSGVVSFVCRVTNEAGFVDSTAVNLTVKHKAGDWVTVKEPTTTKTGLQERYCTACNTKVESKTLAKKPTEAPKVNFTDVKKSDFFYTPVQWAVANGVTTGTSKTTFGPNESCTRAQAVTFLWRAAGCPAPKSTNNPFKDVKKSDYYYNAVLWAAGSGVTSGTSKTEFSPNDVCTRGQIVTFLWRSQGQKKVSASNPFKDVKTSDFYYNAVLWAVKNNVTAGTSPTTFEPNANCTRGQIVTFLYRAIVK